MKLQYLLLVAALQIGVTIQGACPKTGECAIAPKCRPGHVCPQVITQGSWQTDKQGACVCARLNVLPKNL